MPKTGKVVDISDRDWLFVGTGVGFKNDIAGIGDDIRLLHDFLSGKPTPLNEVRAAVVRALRNGWDTMGYGKTLVSMLFDRNLRPNGWASAWTVDFKRTDGGQSNLHRDFQIAVAIQAVRDCGKSYNEAMAWAAETCGIGVRRAQQIYAEHKDKFRNRIVNKKKLKVAPENVADLIALRLRSSEDS